MRGTRVRAFPKTRLTALLILGALLTGCSGLPGAPSSLALSRTEDSPVPSPFPAFDTQPARAGYVPSSVMSYADANGPSRDVEVLMAYYADVYSVPLSLVRHVAHRESTFNPAARNGPYWGLMQILPATARSMGYRGSPEGLLDPDTNLRYAVKYLAGAYVVAGGDEARADALYRKGYYYEAKRLGLLEKSGLR